MALVRPGVSLPRCASRHPSVQASRLRPRSPSFDVTTYEGLGKLDRFRLATVRTHRSHGSRLGHPTTMGAVDGSDPGRHRPISATHDSVIKTGTRCPGTLHNTFPRDVMARASRRYSQPRRSRSHLEGIVLLRCVSARTENASSPADSPTEHDNVASTGVARGSFRASAFEHGASPRWSRPASPTRVNGLGFVDGPKHLPLPSLVSPLRLGRARRSWPPGRRRMSTTAQLEFPNDVGSFYSVLYQPAQGAITTSVPTRRPVLTPLLRGSPSGGLV